MSSHSSFSAGDDKQPHSGLAGGQHTVPPPKTQGAATGGQQLSATANQFVDKIDPFSKRANSRRRRRQVNSSRYHSENEPDLVQLPLIKGSFTHFYNLKHMFICVLDTPYQDQTSLAIQK